MYNSRPKYAYTVVKPKCSTPVNEAFPASITVSAHPETSKFIALLYYKK
jgi:hypothetical protein